jgi:hypothetical protein
MFASPKAGMVKQKQYRRERYRLYASLLPAEWEQVQQATGGATLTVWCSAAVLWFESLERQEQARRIWALTSGGKKRFSKHLQVVEWVGDKFLAWHWPVSTMGQVLAAVVLGFLELPTEEREQWCIEVLLPVGTEEASAGPEAPVSLVPALAS